MWSQLAELCRALLLLTSGHGLCPRLTTIPGGGPVRVFALRPAIDERGAFYGRATLERIWD